MFGRKTKIISDEQLMQQICIGNQQAFTDLYERYKDRLYYYFYRMLGNSEELANDFLQEVFLRIIEKPEQFNPAYPFTTWIFSVAHNLCKNEYRRRDIRKQTNTLNADLAIEDSVTETISKEKLVERIFDFIEELNQEQRSVFLLHYREGFALKEIAQMLEIPLGTVKSRLYYTRKYLASQFEHLKDEIEL